MGSSSVPVLSIALCAVSAAVAIGLPAALLVLCRRRTGRGLAAAGVGALCFVVSALVLEQLMHRAVFALFPTLPYNPPLYVLYGCLAAGLFEETGRWVGLRLLCRRDASPVTGFAYGVGHGGIEAVLLVGVSCAANLFLLLSLRAGGAVPAAARAQAEALAAAQPLTFLAPGVERIGAIALHIALSMLMWMVVTRRLPAWFYLAGVALHALTNVGAALYRTGVLTGVWTVELITLAAVAAVCVFVGWLYRRSAPDGRG